MKRLLGTVVGAVFFAFVAAACGASTGDSTTAETTADDTAETAAAAGEPLPEFTATTVSGGQISANDLQGKDVVLWFWAPW